MTGISELQQVLSDLVTERKAVKAATGEAHAAIKDLKATAKTAKAELTDLIAEEVARQVEIVGNDIRAEMRAAMHDVIDGLASEWRTKLGLND